jgi:hypothetical protein
MIKNLFFLLFIIVFLYFSYSFIKNTDFQNLFKEQAEKVIEIPRERADSFIEEKKENVLEELEAEKKNLKEGLKEKSMELWEGLKEIIFNKKRDVDSEE